MGGVFLKQERQPKMEASHWPWANPSVNVSLALLHHGLCEVLVNLFVQTSADAITCKVVSRAHATGYRFT